MTEQKVKRIERKDTTLRKILAMPDNKRSSLDLNKRTLSQIAAIPFFTAETINVTFKTNKTSGKSEGTITFDLSVAKSKRRQKRNEKGSPSTSFTFALGTPANSFLLCHTSAVVSEGQHKALSTRSIEMNFDWNLANSCGGAGKGHIILRILNTDVRGMDLEYWVPLK